MVSGRVPAMSWRWLSWRRTRANLRAQRTLRKPAGAEGPVWSTQRPLPPHRRPVADRESGLCPASPLTRVTLWNTSSCYSPAWPREQPRCHLGAASAPCPPAWRASLLPGSPPQACHEPRCAPGAVLPPQAPQTVAPSAVRPL